MHVSLKTITFAFILRRRSSRTDDIVYRRRAGGKGANHAEAVARAGVAVSLVGAVGEDGAWLIRDLECYGESTANLSVVQVRYVPVFPRIICYIIYCGRRSLVALSFNLLHKAKIASVPESTPTCA